MPFDRYHPVEVMRRLTSAKTDKAKSKVIVELWDSTREEFFVGLQLSMDPNIKFGLEKVVEIEDDDDGEPGSFTFNDFIKLVEKLTNSDVDITTRKQLVREAAMVSGITEWNLWYRQILLKTLHTSLPMNVIVTTLQELTKR